MIKRDVELKFLANALIPPGFILQNPNNFQVRIALEESDLITNNVMYKYNCDNQRTCTATINIAILTGMLNYNVTIGNLQPATSIDSIISSTTTQFTNKGFIQINDILAYSLNDDPLDTDYWLDIVKGEEFITGIDGVSVFRTRNSKSFMRMLKRPNQNKTISIPYKIIIHSGKKRE